MWDSIFREHVDSAGCVVDGRSLAVRKSEIVTSDKVKYTAYSFLCYSYPFQDVVFRDWQNITLAHAEIFEVDECV